MEDQRGLKLHVQLDVHVDDPDKLDTYVQEWVRQHFEGDAKAIAESLLEAGESAGSALQLVTDPEMLVYGIPGIQAAGATWWAEAADIMDTGTAATVSTADDQKSARSDDEIVEDILESAKEIPGLDLERLGYDESEADPDRRKRSLRAATALAGAIAWSYESLVDELIGDIVVLRASGSIDETWRVGDLPALYRHQCGALFAQRFLAVTIDLGTSMVCGFRSPTCVAQELGLRLLLDGVEVLAGSYPGLELADNWRARAEDSLFEDLDHETLYSPAFDGISSDPSYAHLGMADLNLSSWFVPFSGRAVNPYAADTEKPQPSSGLEVSPSAENEP